MNELIKIHISEDRQLVDARELHEFLNVSSRFNDWITGRINKYGFIEGQDFTAFTENIVNGGRKIEYAITLDMAKELSMVENNEKGRIARKYFIQKEKEAKFNVAQISKKDLAKMLYDSEVEKERLQILSKNQQSEIARLEPKAQYLNQILDDESLIDIGQAAKILGLPYGRNTLFKKLREKGIFFKQRNEPLQEYVDRGYFVLKEKRIELDEGKSFIVIKVLVTQKGLEFIAKTVDYKAEQGKLMLIQ